MKKVKVYNVSNHPSTEWSEEQVKAAKEKAMFLSESNIVEIEDVPFPNIPPNMDKDDVADLADEVLTKIQNANDASFIIINGEMNFVFSFVSFAIQRGLRCFTATTERISEDKKNEDGTTEKVSIFKFIKLREYLNE